MDDRIISNNNAIGYYSGLNGLINALSVTVSGNTTNYSPSVNTQGNEYGYINT